MTGVKLEEHKDLRMKKRSRPLLHSAMNQSDPDNLPIGSISLTCVDLVTEMQLLVVQLGNVR